MGPKGWKKMSDTDCRGDIHSGRRTGDLEINNGPIGGAGPIRFRGYGDRWPESYVKTGV